MTRQEAYTTTISAALDLRSCRQCHGTGTARVKVGQVFETDSDEEVQLAYQTTTCPTCDKLRVNALAALEELMKDSERAIPVDKESLTTPPCECSARKALEEFADDANWFDCAHGHRLVPAWRGPDEDRPERLAFLALSSTCQLLQDVQKLRAELEAANRQRDEAIAEGRQKAADAMATYGQQLTGIDAANQRAEKAAGDLAEALVICQSYAAQNPPHGYPLQDPMGVYALLAKHAKEGKDAE